MMDLSSPAKEQQTSPGKEEDKAQQAEVVYPSLHDVIEQENE